jgi:hypothetical protein
MMLAESELSSHLLTRVFMQDYGQPPSTGNRAVTWEQKAVADRTDCPLQARKRRSNDPHPLVVQVLILKRISQSAAGCKELQQALAVVSPNDVHAARALSDMGARVFAPVMAVEEQGIMTSWPFARHLAVAIGQVGFIPNAVTTQKLGCLCRVVISSREVNVIRIAENSGRASVTNMTK